MSEFDPKIDPKKIKMGDEGSAFKEVANAYGEWMKGLENFHKLNPQKQNDYIVGFGKDLNTLLLILQDYTLQRTDDVDDRGNQI